MYHLPSSASCHPRIKSPYLAQMRVMTPLLFTFVIREMLIEHLPEPGAENIDLGQESRGGGLGGQIGSQERL